MPKPIAKSQDVRSPRELLQGIYSAQLLPDEQEQTFDALHEALFSDLDPGTAYEALIAEQIVALEWDALRHRRLRDTLLLAECRDLAVGAFHNGRIGRDYSLDKGSDAEKLANKLVSNSAKARATAAMALSERGVRPEEIMAEAYRKLAKELEPHERQIADIETRRRKLRDDFDRLKAARARRVPDAEVIEE